LTGRLIAQVRTGKADKQAWRNIRLVAWFIAWQAGRKAGRKPGNTTRLEFGCSNTPPR